MFKLFQSKSSQLKIQESKIKKSIAKEQKKLHKYEHILELLKPLKKYIDKIDQTWKDMAKGRRSLSDDLYTLADNEYSVASRASNMLRGGLENWSDSLLTPSDFEQLETQIRNTKIKIEKLYKELKSQQYSTETELLTILNSNLRN